MALPTSCHPAAQAGPNPPPRRQALQALGAVVVHGACGGLLATANLAAWAQTPNLAPNQSPPQRQSPPLSAPTAIGPDADLPGARVLGQAKLRFWGLEVYDARLWVRPGFEPDHFDRHPFALELVYLRSLVGERIAQRSLDEMRALPGFDPVRGPAWLARMKALFPDVAKGDRLTGLHRPGMGATFRLNGRHLGDVDDAAFSALFFGIWLSAATSEPRMRQGLLGLGT